MITLAHDLSDIAELVRRGSIVHIVEERHDLPNLVRTACGRDVLATRTFGPDVEPELVICPRCASHASRCG